MDEGLLEIIKKQEQAIKVLFYEIFDKSIYRVDLAVENGNVFVNLVYRRRERIENGVTIQCYRYRYYKRPYGYEKDGYIQCYFVIDTFLPSITINQLNHALKIIEKTIKGAIIKWEQAL